MATYTSITMLSSLSHFLWKLSIKLTLDYHLTQLLSDPTGYCLFTQATQPLPVSNPDTLLPGYIFIYQTMTCHSYVVKSTNDTTLGEEAVLPEERTTSAAWKSRPMRPAWGLTKRNVKSCTWDAGIPHSSRRDVWLPEAQPGGSWWMAIWMRSSSAPSHRWRQTLSWAASTRVQPANQGLWLFQFI